MMNIFLRRLFKPQPALSLIELLVALTILALLSTAGLKMFQSTQTSFVGGRTSLVKVKRNEAIAAFIYNDFVDKALPTTTAPQLYINSQMSDDLQAAEKLAVATIFVTDCRFQFAAPKCRLSRDADPDLGNVSFPADCMRFGQITIAQRVNQILALGTKIVFSIDGISTRCSNSKPLEGTDVGDMAVTHLDDSLCLRMANDLQNVPQTGDHIMLPRFVVFNSVDPASFHTSFIENVSASTTGLNIDAPNRIKMRSDEENFISTIDLITRDPTARVGVVLALNDRFGTPNDPDIKLGAAISIDVATHR